MHPNYKLTEEDKLEVVRLYNNEKLSTYAIADIFKLSQSSIYELLKRRNILFRKKPKPIISGDVLISEYKNGKTVRKIAENYKIRIAVIYKILKQNKVELRCDYGPKYKWSKLRPRIIELFNLGKSRKEIAQILNIQKSYVYIILKDAGYKIGLKSRTKHDVNQNFFEKINCEANAYFLGLLYADGYVSNRTSNYRMTISLKYPDEHILEQFISSIQYKGILKKYINNCGNEMVSLQIYSQKIVKDLINLGCFQCKSAIIRFPKVEQVPVPLIHHFVRGFFDGDGTIWHSKTARKDRWCVSIISNKDFINDIKEEFLEPNFIKNNTAFRPNKHYKDISITGNIQIRDFLTLIYKNATIYLKRKYLLYEEFIKHHNEILGKPKHWTYRKRDFYGKYF
ncbi:MAG: helix-turn-helix domain-containing protein [Nanoarchaeota archaeon]